MSLNILERKQTSAELYENYRISGLTREIIQADLHFSETQLENTFAVGSIENPVDVWKLRDYMEETILEQGKKPYPYSKLKNNIYYPYKKDWDNRKGVVING